MLKQFIIFLTGITFLFSFASAVTEERDESQIESQLVNEIFCPCWGLDTNECHLIINKLRIAQGRSDYEKILIDFYNVIKTLNPKTFNPSEWHDDEDALSVEPTHRILIENSRVRILEVVIPPGYKQAYHTHRWAGITVDLIPSDFMLYNQQGQFLLRATDDPVWHHEEGQPLHATTNIGDVTYIGLHFELK